MNPKWCVVCAGFALNAFGFDGQPLQYRVDWGPLQVAQFELTLFSGDGVRSVNAEVESRGVSRLFGSFQSSLEILHADGFRLLNGRSTWDEGLSELTVSWTDPDAPPVVDLFRSKPRKSALSPVPPESTLNTVDPFVPVFDISERLNHNGRCEGAYRIFDGIRRYDLTLRDAGDQALVGDSAAEFSGPVHLCQLDLSRIGGFSTEGRLFQFEESELRRTLFFGQIPGRSRTHWIPVRFEIESPLATVVAQVVMPRPDQSEAADPRIMR